MGSCASNARAVADKRMAVAMEKHIPLQDDEKMNGFGCNGDSIKLAVFGPSGSGKTSLLKQMNPLGGKQSNEKNDKNEAVFEHSIVCDDVQFKLYEVHHTQNAWKKWVHVFDSCQALFFVVGIDEYDEIDEKERKTKLELAMDMFKEVSSMKCFKNSPIVLLLTKKDLFDRKLLTVPFRIEGKRYDDFQRSSWMTENNDNKGIEEYSREVTDYIFNCFKNEDVYRGRDIYHYVTDINDSNSFKKVYEFCKDMNLKSDLRDGGFM